MLTDSFDMSQRRLTLNVCGWFSLLCWLPWLTFALAGGPVEFPGWMFAILFWSLFLSPLTGAALALIAATARRWWLMLAAVWLAALTYEWWDLTHHPFDL